MGFFSKTHFLLHHFYTIPACTFIALYNISYTRRFVEAQYLLGFVGSHGVAKTYEARPSDYTSYVTPERSKLQKPFNSKAIGILRVPYDGYPALLHEGEEVRTASASRAGDDSQGYIININNPVVREEQDFYRLTQQIVGAIRQQAAIQAG